ncbi:MAG: cell division protein FtsZ [Candidatus Tokpelaia sp. JSC188]|nr:MAG: cell division protein FtsZ [Candidatus Tokpelaia sp. JSC188]
MTINLHKPDITELKPRMNVFGVGGGGGNAVNNMINAGLQGVEFVVANTDAQALTMSKAERVIQLGAAVTEGLGAGSHPEVGRAAAEECLDEILDHLTHSHMVFVTAGMGGGTGTGAAPVIARAAREKGLLTVGVVTKPFHFEGQRRMKTAESGIEELQKSVDTLIVIPNQNLFRIANEKTTFADAFSMADQVLYSGVASITDLMVREGLINLDFADVRSVMHDMGKAMMGTGEASDQGRALAAAEAAIANPLLDETSMRGARGLLISITGGRDMTLFEVDEAANRIREEVDPEANVIFGAIVDEALEGIIRVSVVATGIDRVVNESVQSTVVPVYPQPVKKLEVATPIEAKSEQLHSDSLLEVMEVLEEEISSSAEELFCPRSQIFGKIPLSNGQVTTKPPAAHHQSAINPASLQSASSLSSFESEQKSVRKTNLAHEMTLHDSNVPKTYNSKIDDLSVGNQINTHERHIFQRRHGYNPRSLWHRLTQGFIHRDDEELGARLEPAHVQPDEHGVRSVIKQEQISRPIVQDATIYAPRRVSSETQIRVSQYIDESEDEKLEIPAFLRRQTN